MSTTIYVSGIQLTETHDSKYIKYLVDELNQPSRNPDGILPKVVFVTTAGLSSFENYVTVSSYPATVAESFSEIDGVPTLVLKANLYLTNEVLNALIEDLRTTFDYIFVNATLINFGGHIRNKNTMPIEADFYITSSYNNKYAPARELFSGNATSIVPSCSSETSSINENHDGEAALIRKNDEVSLYSSDADGYINRHIMENDTNIIQGGRELRKNIYNVIDVITQVKDIKDISLEIHDQKSGTMVIPERSIKIISGIAALNLTILIPSIVGVLISALSIPVASAIFVFVILICWIVFYDDIIFEKEPNSQIFRVDTVDIPALEKATGEKADVQELLSDVLSENSLLIEDKETPLVKALDQGGPNKKIY